MSVKYDAGRMRPSLVLLSMSRALQSVSEVATFGANKYTDDGWREVPDGVRRYTDAMLRHLLAEASGEVNDPESGLPHAAHIAWNALARLDLDLRVQMALAAANAEPSTGIPDGIYDNLHTCCRETYRYGQVIASMSAAVICANPLYGLRPAWRTYPDLPR